jgi:hypothetical protein
MVALLLVASPPELHGQKRDFCQGFAEGWKSIKGELTLAPICPIEPVTPVGSNSYREGIKAGMRAGQRVDGGNSGGGNSRTDQTDFCGGFEEGWKSIKGDLSIVPICPIAPITPIGSTAYREGLKAGVAKAKRP